MLVYIVSIKHFSFIKHLLLNIQKQMHDSLYSVNYKDLLPICMISLGFCDCDSICCYLFIFIFLPNNSDNVFL
jgi:hypothetical protein